MEQIQKRMYQYTVLINGGHRRTRQGAGGGGGAVAMKTMEIRGNARENEENLGKYITKYVKFWSFHFNI
jgi:hypothetical protein